MYFGDPSLALAPFSNFACCCWSIWNPIASMEAIELTAAAAAAARKGWVILKRESSVSATEV